MAKKAQKPNASSDAKAKSRTPKKKELEIIYRRNKILDLRETGASIRQISEHLISDGAKNLMDGDPDLTIEKARAKARKGLSPTMVHEHLAAALEDLYKTQRLKTKHLVVIEINKMERVELAHFTRLLRETNPDSIEKLSRALERVWKRRDALLGLHKPLKIQIDPRETLAKLLGKSPEELPDGDSDA